MTRTYLTRFSALIGLLLLVAITAEAAPFGTPKEEFRSAWVATVWRLDWPHEATAGVTQLVADKQKQQMINLLDSLKANNMNAINFQVRSMCDAMYKSSYEPWSSYLTNTRGVAPLYDPLEFVVEECHKRGMECHAWVNPYRFSSGTDWNTPQDKVLKEDGWLLQYGNYIVLDPGQQRTIDRIVDVCREIITNYDVDGILYDDYFYPNNIPETSAAGDYQEWLDSGTSLSIGDWRRDNVNRMVKAVYDMIQETRPEVRYGISPAGVACSSSAVAAKYGITPCPGSDWQYNTIYSDPIAWYDQHTIDYMSPQVYWKIGNTSADYGKITPWWNSVAKKFGRHMYVSHSISSVTADSKGSANPTPGLTYNKSYLFDEYANEVELMRTTNEDGAPGSIFYSCKYLYRMGAPEELVRYFHRTTYTYPSLPPAMPWKEGYNPGPVQDLAFDGTTLTWQGYDNVRYTVYAIPRTVNQISFTKNVQFLQGISYATEYAIPANLTDGYYYAVCVLDRVGNEYDPVFCGTPFDPLPAPVLVAPENGADVFHPFTLSWQAVDGAEQYLVEVATDQQMNNIVESVTTEGTSLSSELLPNLTSKAVHYWRVQSMSSTNSNGISEVRVFTPTLLQITSPANGEVGVSLTTTVTWDAPDNETLARLTIATDEAMTNVIYITEAAGGSHTLPADALQSGCGYYATVGLRYDGNDMVSRPVFFTTEFLPPVLRTPDFDGDVVYADDFFSIVPQTMATNLTFDVSNSATVWGRTRFTETVGEGTYQTTKTAGEIKVSSKLLVDGTTYYARARTAYTDANGVSHYTDYCTPVPFVYNAGNRPAGSPADINHDGIVDVADLNIVINVALGGTSEYNADINHDGVVDVADLNIVINAMLSGE